MDYRRFKKVKVGFQHDTAAEGAAEEKTFEDMAEERQALRRAAMAEATLTDKRTIIARKMYNNQGVTVEDWPTLTKLDPKERTILIRDVRRIYGLPEQRKQIVLSRR